MFRSGKEAGLALAFLDVHVGGEKGREEGEGDASDAVCVAWEEGGVWWAFEVCSGVHAKWIRKVQRSQKAKRVERWVPRGLLIRSFLTFPARIPSPVIL
jgi:hypothetical protein